MPASLLADEVTREKVLWRSGMKVTCLGDVLLGKPREGSTQWQGKGGAQG